MASNHDNTDNDDTFKKTITDGAVRPSITVQLIRHAESHNNQVYRNARYIYRGGTPEFDFDGWKHYVDAHRSADPGLSDVGVEQAQALARYLVPLIDNATGEVHIITSPMKRTLDTIQPTLTQCQPQTTRHTIVVHGFYFESEGCHCKDVALEGMSPDEIRNYLQQTTNTNTAPISFVGFPHPHRGWYVQHTTAETRAQAETRAAKFYVWLCEHLDLQLQQTRRNRTFLIGHGDFMSLVLKRIVAGFSHSVETPGIPHRSAFVHYNTGITELEYFGNGRFLIMGHNQTPHLIAMEQLKTGGSLKDGWSYLMPDDQFVLDQEVDVAFSDELEDHVREQAEALKALYLSSEASDKLSTDQNLSVEEEEERTQRKTQFIVKRGRQVVGVATYSEVTGQLTDVAVRPSAGKRVSETLFNAVKAHSKTLGRSGSLYVMPRSSESKEMFESLGFAEIGEAVPKMEYRHE